jgi:hypothetical protein
MDKILIKKLIIYKKAKNLLLLFLMSRITPWIIR